MAKDSVEKKIREVLRERTLAPGENSWNKIEDQLGSSRKTAKKGYWSYGIAAGFIGILFISIFYLYQPVTEVIPAQEVVNTSENNSEVPNTFEIQNSLNEEFKNISDIVHKDPLQENIQLPKSVIPQSIEQKEFLEENVAEGIVSLEKVDTKIAEVITQVANLEQTQGTVGDATIDSLLRTAQKELLGERISGESQSVDAMALLSDVEDELNRSLRDQLFEKLKDGYVKVRSAIAYRNE